MTLPDNIKSRIERESSDIDGTTVWAERAWKLREALSMTRGQLIHSVNRDICLDALREFDEGMK